jgi:hypothetical protein
MQGVYLLYLAWSLGLGVKRNEAMLNMQTIAL